MHFLFIVFQRRPPMNTSIYIVKWNTNLYRTTLLILFASILSIATSLRSDKYGRYTPQNNSNEKKYPIHTLILCRHGDSIWNGGQPGTRETFTGWTDVPLSSRGIQEAKNTGEQVAGYYPYGIDACFTSILGRAQLTAHYCMWGFSEMDSRIAPRRYISDYRLNERHYGSLQGYVKADVEAGLYGHDPKLVQEWRRSWYTVPPLLEEQDPRRIEEVRKYSNYCDGSQNVPLGESLDMVANDRIKPFLRSTITPILNNAAKDRAVKLQDADGGDFNGNRRASINIFNKQSGNSVCNSLAGDSGGTALVVAHANSLRALIGVICNVSENPVALRKLEDMKIQTGVPLVMRYQQASENRYKPIDMLSSSEPQELLNLPPSAQPHPDLPVWPLHCLPLLLGVQKRNFNYKDNNTITTGIDKRRIKLSSNKMTTSAERMEQMLSL